MRTIIYLSITAVIIYMLRLIPLLLIKNKIKSRFFNSFFTYMPYAILSALIFPEVFYSTGSLMTAAAGAASATILAIIGLPFPVISLLSCLIVYLANL